NAKKTDYIYVATSDGTAANSNIHCVDQYSGTIDSTREIALSEVPHDIALSAMGDKLSVTYGDALNKVGAYDVINNSKLDINVTESNYAITPLNEGYAKNQRGNTAFTKNYLLSADSKIAGTKNTYAFDFANIYKTQNEEFSLNSSWTIKKIIGLNNGGFLTLAGKTDGTSLIDWFGRDGTGAYSRNARWISGVVAKQQAKELPVKMLDDASATEVPDTWSGYTLLYHLVNFSVGTKITKFRFVSGYTGTVVRYVTPVLLEDQGSGKYKVKDYGQGVAVTEEGEYEESINWKISGVIENDKYFPGVWYGNPLPHSVNKGVIKYNNSAPLSFYADIGVNNSGNDTSEIIINKLVSKQSSNNRNYQIQFIAEETLVTAEKFPPKFTQDIVIGRDDRVLALATSDSVSQSVKFYDFAANNFGAETQLKGMAADYRTQTLDLANSAVKSGLSYKESPGVNLIEAITSNETIWNSIRNYPANYNELGVSSDLRVGTDKRFFGYYSSYTKDGTLSPVKSFATATKGKTRLFADQLLSMYDAVWQRFYDNYFRINNADAHESLVQFDQAGNGERKVKQYAAASIAGYDDINTYLISDYTKKIKNESFTVLSVPKGVDAGVFKSYRWIDPGPGRVLEFRLPINSYGNVKVDLMFCESYFSASDKRLFDISIEGKTVETKLDIYREAGGKNIALLRTYDTEVFDGVLNVKFTNLSPTCENAMISGIRVTYTDKNTPDLYFYCKASSSGTSDIAPYTDTYGFSWNKLAIPTNAKVTDHPLTSSQITSVPDGTTKEIFMSPYLLTGSANDFTCSIPFTGSNKADITIYYIEHYHTSAGQRKFNVYVEGEKRENELDVFYESGGASGGAKKGLARRYTGINVTGGSIDIKFEKGSADVPLFCAVSVSYIGSSQKLQNGGIFTQTDLSKLDGSVTTTGSGYAATTDMGNGWNKIASESVTPFRFEPVYMGEEEIYPATNYLYRKMLFGRDVASPTLFLFSNRRVTSTAGKA
ncbi:MAG: malectin domain-containing carbohydrate-binding protein, partial [Balneolaceae bacterium]